MTLQSVFIFRIIIGTLFIIEYFVGIDGHGRGGGRLMTLLFGSAFVLYGVYGSLQRASLRRRRITSINRAGHSATNNPTGTV